MTSQDHLLLFQIKSCLASLKRSQQQRTGLHWQAIHTHITPSSQTNTLSIWTSLAATFLILLFMHGMLIPDTEICERSPHNTTTMCYSWVNKFRAILPAKLLHCIYYHISLQNNFHSHFQRFCPCPKWDMAAHPNKRLTEWDSSQLNWNICLKYFSFTGCYQTRMLKFIQLLIFILSDTVTKQNCSMHIKLC